MLVSNWRTVSQVILVELCAAPCRGVCRGCHADNGYIEPGFVNEFRGGNCKTILEDACCWGQWGSLRGWGTSSKPLTAHCLLEQAANQCCARSDVPSIQFNATSPSVRKRTNPPSGREGAAASGSSVLRRIVRQH
jgi:hypothetical protein